MAVATAALAERLRDMADRLERDVDAKRNSRRENTPKQQREATSARIDAAHLERAMNALRLLASAHDDGTIPVALSGIKTKVMVLDFLRTKVGSNSYYDVHDTGEFTNNTPLALELRKFIENCKTGADRERDAERAERDRIQKLESGLKFSAIPGFFPTPLDVIRTMLDYADIEDGQLVLEPSAGKGDIADALREHFGAAVTVHCVERMHSLVELLQAKGHTVIGRDALETSGDYDRILMNPPFENGQDIQHVRHAYDCCLKAGGRLVSVMSTGPFHRSDKQSVAFREWASEIDADVHELPPDAFKNAFRSTGVNCKLLVASK